MCAGFGNLEILEGLEILKVSKFLGVRRSLRF